MIYIPYGIVQQNYDYRPYNADNSTNTEYNVSTHNGNNTNG